MSDKSSAPFLDLLRSLGIDIEQSTEIHIHLEAGKLPRVSVTSLVLTKGKAPEVVSDEYEVRRK